ncbi:RsiV family protein [Mycolicibacterium cosmeticum]|uniref:RsiV family protein n=1 Tax=Mycolicibacterium cosmeticum TaxID=258533 RepID=UPI003204D2CC
MSLWTAPVTSASAQDLCNELNGEWDGRYCRASVVSERMATREIKVAVPTDLVDDPTVGPAIRPYLRELFNNWRGKAATMVQDSWGEENHHVFHHGTAISIVFHEEYHAAGPAFNNAYRTFTFDVATGKQLGLGDIVATGVDPLVAIPALAKPYLQRALDQAAWQHIPGSYPFSIDRWAPDQPFSGGFRSWALTSDELVFYMPDYPVGHDSPIQYHQLQQWSMDGGTVQVHIPLIALDSVLRPQYSVT